MHVAWKLRKPASFERLDIDPPDAECCCNRPDRQAKAQTGFPKFSPQLCRATFLIKHGIPPMTYSPQQLRDAPPPLEPAFQRTTLRITPM